MEWVTKTVSPQPGLDLRTFQMKQLKKACWRWWFDTPEMLFQNRTGIIKYLWLKYILSTEGPPPHPFPPAASHPTLEWRHGWLIVQPYNYWNLLVCSASVSWLVEGWRVFQNDHTSSFNMSCRDQPAELDRSLHCGMSKTKVVNKWMDSDRLFV
jgi:hypothetical protein